MVALAFFAGAAFVAAFFAGALAAGAFAAALAGVAFVAAFFAGAFFATRAGAFFAAAFTGSGATSTMSETTVAAPRISTEAALRASSSTWEARAATVAPSPWTSRVRRSTSSLPTAESTSRRTRRTICLRLASAALSRSSASALACLASFLREVSWLARAMIS